MSVRGYRIVFTDPPSGPGAHRIQNFAEDVYRDLAAAGIGTVPNMDSARTEVIVEVSASRHLGTALRTIRLQLGRSNFNDNVSIVSLR
jgi:hypothetical protein